MSLLHFLFFYSMRLSHEHFRTTPKSIWNNRNSISHTYRILQKLIPKNTWCSFMCKNLNFCDFPRFQYLLWIRISSRMLQYIFKDVTVLLCPRHTTNSSPLKKFWVQKVTYNLRKSDHTLSIGCRSFSLQAIDVSWMYQLGNKWKNFELKLWVVSWLYQSENRT